VIPIVRSEFLRHRKADAPGVHITAFPGARRERQRRGFHRLGMLDGVLAVRRADDALPTELIMVAL
jgi:hypothetical protein